MSHWPMASLQMCAITTLITHWSVMIIFLLKTPRKEPPVWSTTTHPPTHTEHNARTYNHIAHMPRTHAAHIMPTNMQWLTHIFSFSQISLPFVQKQITLSVLSALHIQVCVSVRVWECVSVRVWECVSVWVCECVSVRVCECESVCEGERSDLKSGVHWACERDRE